jgi:hypothetical protein
VEELACPTTDDDPFVKWRFREEQTPILDTGSSILKNKNQFWDGKTFLKEGCSEGRTLTERLF